MTGRNNITSRQMALFTFVTQTGLGFIGLPTVLAKEVGHDGWISVLITGVICIILSMLFLLLLKRYSDKGIFDINKLIFGKWIGGIFNAILVVYLILAAARGVRVFTVFIRLTVLPFTPPLVMSPFILLPSIYLVWQGLKYVSRFKYVSVLSYIVFLVFMSLLLGDLRRSFLLPLGEAGSKQILSSITTSFRAFIGFELIMFLFPEITDKSKAFKWHLFAIVLSTLFFIIIVTVCTSFFGENFLKIQVVPLFNLARSYNAPVIERVDLYLISLWFVVMGCAMRGYMIAGYYGLGKVFNIKKTKLSFSLYFLLLYAISRVPQDINKAFRFMDIVGYLTMGVSVFFVVCLILSFVRKKGVKTQ
ncbi:spore germination protein [Clostridium aceticum]|uniref:Spore germination protein n=1 Tax=Clostridium aceticum TaxID=84022 RepID=A0A0D8IAQ2_9CLOT|nr:GerAB/ArcD/ProY family transporter [Clostridium aceticum]AKL96477.1 spore germination protein [Clostridium aceticum]KJF27350.1 hypothetical protein TZ02_08420 [Clostridium aceticum]